MGQSRERELQLEFLKQNAGVTIQNLLFRHSNEMDSAAFRKNYASLLKLPEVAYWKGKVPTSIDMTTIVGSGDACFENSCGKLISIGVDIKDILSPDLLSRSIAFAISSHEGEIYEMLARYIVAGYLFIGNCADESVRQIVLDRIDKLHSYVSNTPSKYDIFIDPDGFSIPKAYRSKKLVNPDLYVGGQITLPLIHDIFIFAHIQEWISAAYRKKISAIIDYVACDQYQNLDYGYGLVKSPKNKFHFLGWSAHMPFYNATLSTDYFKKGLVFRMPLFGAFENKGIENWREKLRDLFMDYKDADGQYCFPADFLTEIKDSYFLNGRHTSLNENRRRKIGKALESTFYAYRAGL